MMKFKGIFSLLLAAALMFSLVGCKTSPSEDVVSAPDESRPVNIVADPKGALEEIYKSIDIKEIAVADDVLMRSTLGFDLNNIEEYHVRYSSGRYGIADVYILKPFDRFYDVVREQLESIKLNRIKTAESYDVLGSYKIAQEAKIFQYGSYIIMLMLEDNDAAQEIIQKYFPSN